MRCGRNLIRTFSEYYRVIGTIPTNLAVEICRKRNRPRTHRARSTIRTSTRQRPKTTRNRVELHFSDLNINYDSETSGDELQHTNNKYSSPNRYLPQKSDFEYRKIGDKEWLSYGKSVSPPPTTYIVMPEPSLSIIDFNMITRNGLEEATKRSRHRSH